MLSITINPSDRGYRSIEHEMWCASVSVRSFVLTLRADFCLEMNPAPGPVLTLASSSIERLISIFPSAPLSPDWNDPEVSVTASTPARQAKEKVYQVQRAVRGWYKLDEYSDVRKVSVGEIKSRGAMCYQPNTLHSVILLI